MSKSKSKKIQKDEYNYIEHHKNTENSILGIDFSKNKEQKELIRLMNQNNLPYIFCFGDAGTGKTFTALAAAIDLVKIRKKYSKIFYIREPLEVGRSIGYIPGDVSDKFGVYLGGLFDNLEHISAFSGIAVNDLKHCIENIPPQFVRGRSFENSILIVDEAQNLSLETIQTLMTRLGQYCKMVFIGSMNQIDVRNKTKDNNDFKTSFEIVKDCEFVDSVELIKSERSEYCAIIDELFTKYRNK